MQIPDSFLQELSLRLDIEQLVSPHVQLRRAGRSMVGLCPFHNERTPSFHIYPENNSFFCFGCGAGGSAYNFVMRMERLDFVEAVKALSQRVGMQLPEDNYDDSLAKSRQRVLSANREAARFFHAQLSRPEGQAGLEYWKSRRLTPQVIQRFGLGYALPDWRALRDYLRDKGYSDEELLAANLIRKSDKEGRVSWYDSFRGRVMVPILDLRGNVLAFGGRVLDDSKPKYINTSDTLAYKKGRDVFALNLAKNTGQEQLILAEGYMDVIALHQAGFTQAVACLGTALTRDQAQLLARYADEVVLSYDADEAGQAATQKALAVLGQTNLKLRVVHLTGGKDPDDILRAWGPEKYRQLLEGAANDIEFKLLAARGNLDLTVPAGKSEYLREACKILALCGSIEQDLYASRLAEEMAVSKEAILTQINQVRKRDDRKQERDHHKDLMKIQDAKRLRVDPQRGLYPAAASAEARLLGLLLRHPDFYIKLRDKLQPEDFVTSFNRELCAKLFARLENGQGIEAELLSGALTEQELDEAMRMRAQAEDIANPLAELEGCAHKILEEKRGMEKVNVTQLDENAYLGLFADMKGQGGIA